MKRASLLLVFLLLLFALPARAAEPGLYAGAVSASDDVFGFSDAIVMVADGGITLRVTAAAGDGMPLYLGDEAIRPSVNGKGLYTYTLPLPALDEPVELTWHDAAGYGHAFTLTVPAESLSPLGGAAEATAEPGEEIDPAALGDGSYAVADFAFSGGSGKVTLTCEGITVEDGAATARIVFSSPRYGYVKVDGVRYDGVYTDHTSAFLVPVKLGADMTLTGMTTAMSKPHEIDYTVRVTPGDRPD